MRDTMILSLVTLICPSFSVRGQGVAEPSQVTLFSSLGHNHDTSRTSINFATGELGFDRQQSLIQNYDLSYGTLKVNQDGDWLEVRDARSMIVDLGERRWDDFKETPPLPPSKMSRAPTLAEHKIIDASAGTTNVSPLRQYVQAKVGHMYLMRVLRGGRVVYVMFRVESLRREDSCQLSWKKVAPPKVVDEK
jgi:hypothetical protein